MDGGQAAREGESDDDEFKPPLLLRLVQRWLPATEDYHGVQLTVVENGRRLVTPMLIVLVALGATDLLFAFDSIPAIFGLTSEPYLVFMANVFALMGLRQLYFLLGDLLKRLVYLNIGLAVLLGFIGVKLILHALAENEVPFINGGEPVPWARDPDRVSLASIVVILGATTIASLWKVRRDARGRAQTLQGPSATSHSRTSVRRSTSSTANGSAARIASSSARSVVRKTSSAPADPSTNGPSRAGSTGRPGRRGAQDGSGRVPRRCLWAYVYRTA